MLSLEERRNYQKLVIAYKIKDGMTPTHLNNLFPETVGLSLHLFRYLRSILYGVDRYLYVSVLASLINLHVFMHLK